LIIRILFVLVAVAVSVIFNLGQPGFYAYPIAAFAVSAVIALVEMLAKGYHKGNVSRIFMGFIVGLVLGAAFASIARSFGLEVTAFHRALIYLCTLYVGIALISQLDIGIGLQHREGQKGDGCESRKILDTSVIIDGRIADICQTSFVEGPLVVPGFILEELRHIADSSDTLKRNRGRRGLDVLNRIQKELQFPVEIYDRDLGANLDVDARLIKLAKLTGGCIITNDYNLNKVAELQGVKVLNINELANAVKPVVLPGEEMLVHVIKDGKETGQGVAYLDDGTMIVVDGGKRHIGETIDVLVTSVLQTAAGRMIFARPKGLEARGSERSSAF
jgi:uncharacterized protein YacL